MALLATWNDGKAREAILDFVERTLAARVPVAERIAVFDNDGTLWCEQPMPIQADFIIRRLAQMAHDDEKLRDRQPWKAAYEQDFSWFGKVIAQHYAGDDHDLMPLLAGILEAYRGMSVEEFEARSEQLRGTRHPTLGRGYLQCAYAPMVDLLGYLVSNGFSTYIASGGGRDFMRPVSLELYGVPRERVIGSASALDYQEDERGGTIVHKAEVDFLDDGPEKPIRIWSRVGRRPVLAAGNANGDIPMLDFAYQPDKPHLRLLLRHDDAEREFDYTTCAEKALERSATEDW